jgi:hypothetical protein
MTDKALLMVLGWAMCATATSFFMGWLLYKKQSTTNKIAKEVVKIKRNKGSNIENDINPRITTETREKRRKQRKPGILKRVLSKRKSLLILFMIVFCFSAKTQIIFEIYDRTAKIDTISDYLLGFGVMDTIFNKIEILARVSFERDRGTYYHSFKLNVFNQYFKLGHVTDTEKGINISSCNVYYSMNIKDIIGRIGGDISYSDKMIYGAYISLQYKSLKIDAAFNSKLYNFSYSYNPKWKISERISIGLIIKGYYIDDKFKRRNGATITILI